MAQALAASGHDVTLHELPGRHDWRFWSAGFDPFLLTLLQGSEHRTRRAGEAHDADA
jgi:enterochelin esterase family protein